MKGRIAKNKVKAYVFSRDGRFGAEISVPAHKGIPVLSKIVSQNQVYVYSTDLHEVHGVPCYVWAGSLNREKTHVCRESGTVSERPTSSIDRPGTTFNRLTGAVERHGMIDPRSLK
jgi:hypothetical protein